MLSVLLRSPLGRVREQDYSKKSDSGGIIPRSGFQANPFSITSYTPLIPGFRPGRADKYQA
tara:strand:- start:958 stop:1140 length:183 start_codon:yes stop_codon:yes gene_type:complete